MGLDMCAFRTNTPIPAVDFNPEEENDAQIAYWRNHPNLHGWMEQLYRSKGGRVGSFSCTQVRIDAADLDALEKALSENALPETKGFHFGEARPELDRAFIAAARAALAEGDFVYYDSWW